MLHYTRLFIRLLYIKGDSYATVHRVHFVKRTRDRTLNMRTRAYQGDRYTLNTYQTNFIHSWTVLQFRMQDACLVLPKPRHINRNLIRTFPHQLHFINSLQLDKIGFK